MISAAFPYQIKYQQILGLEKASVEVGKGDPIVFLHGNPTSSYLWRNIIPYLEGFGRCIAPDLIGMGDSAKLRNPGPTSYTFVEHRSFLDARSSRRCGPLKAKRWCWNKTPSSSSICLLVFSVS